MKTLKSFRLSDKTCLELHKIATNKGISQAEVIEQCIEYFSEHYRVSISDVLSEDVYYALLEDYEQYINSSDGDAVFTIDEFYYYIFLRGCCND